MSAVKERTRQPKGSPTGGEFAAEAGSEASVGLAPAGGNPFTTRYDTIGDKLTAFHTELEHAVKDLRSDDQWNAYLATMSKFHGYSMNNQLLIAMQCPEATHVTGFKKWQELGRQVDKGQKAIQIFAPLTRKLDADAGDPGAFFDPKSGSFKRWGTAGFTTASVFDVSQTSGDELPVGRTAVSGEPPEGLVDDLEAAIAAQGFKVEYSDALGSANGATQPDSKTVQIKASMSPADRASTLAHELGHIAAGHLDRMDEYHRGHGGKRSEMEVEAESISYVMLRANGMDPDSMRGHHDRYVSGWGGQACADEVVRKSAETVAKSVKSLLAIGSWRNAA